MPALDNNVPDSATLTNYGIEEAIALAASKAADAIHQLIKRIEIPEDITSGPGLDEAKTRDPWGKSDKYALGWVFFSVILLVFTSLVRWFHFWTDRIRISIHQAEVSAQYSTESPDTNYELSVLDTDKSTTKIFPRSDASYQYAVPPAKEQSSISSISWVNNTFAILRYILYRPIPALRVRKRWQPIVLPPLGVILVFFAATIFVLLYVFVPQPLYWRSIRFGAPPITVRSGMLALSMLPWIIALSMKANLISIITGIGHERLNVVHRWAAYIFLLLSLIHTIPFYLHNDDGTELRIYKSYFHKTGVYVFGSGMSICDTSMSKLKLFTGIAALVPLCFLCVHSLPWIRNRFYELFIVTHVPVSVLFFGMLFWHCHNYLTSLHYLLATLGIWLFAYITRIFYLNWTNPWRASWLIGDECVITILPEDAVKITVPTQMKWKAGQHIYIRMPGVSIFENHPFTIASLCSDDLPSEYGEDYRDMLIVFRPFGGFTKKVFENALEKGPWHTYRAFIDGPYGGMRRRIEAFDHVILFAGGSGITAVISQLLDLIKRMRDGKALTKTVQVVWALKRPETIEWFKEELRICRESAPPDAIRCQFHITSAKRTSKTGQVVSAASPTRPLSTFFHDRVNDAFQGVANKRWSDMSHKRNSALIKDEAAGNQEKEHELRRENEDAILALPQAHFVPARNKTMQSLSPSPDPANQRISSHPALNHPIQDRRHRQHNLSLDITAAVEGGKSAIAPVTTNAHGFDFGFPSTPTDFQKNLMRFAFLPASVRKKKDGWSTEYGRPDIPYMLREFSADLGRRTCVFVCGPQSMRADVSRTVAQLQKDVWQNPEREELFLHTENYAI